MCPLISSYILDVPFSLSCPYRKSPYSFCQDNQDSARQHLCLPITGTQLLASGTLFYKYVCQ